MLTQDSFPLHISEHSQEWRLASFCTASIGLLCGVLYYTEMKCIYAHAPCRTQCKTAYG